MDFCASNPLLYFKRIVCSSARLGYQYACDYPVVLGAGILLFFLQRLCPSLVMFLLSFSPVFLLTALLLGALLTFGEPGAPVIVEETLGNQRPLSPKSKTSAIDGSSEEIENVAAVAYAEKSFESQVVCVEEKTFDRVVHDEEKTTSVCAEEFSEFANGNVIVETKEQQQRQQNVSVPSNVIVETEEQIKEVTENVESQEYEISNSESYHNEVRSSYQLGELMSSCWQPVMRQDPCSDSESDSSSNASMTDIIPMLDALNHPINLGSGNPSSTFRDNLNSSSDDEDGSEEEDDIGSDQDGAKEKENDESNSEDDDNVGSSDMEKVGNMDSLMEQRREKNMLKFELDKRLMDMQAAEEIQKMEEASRFCVQVPSISTPRPKPLDPSNGSELPKIPDSAPSVLLPWKKPFDQLVDRDRKLQETWTPRSHFPSTQHRKHGNLHLQQSTYLQHHNDVMAEKPGFSRNDACDSLSDSDSEQAGNGGKLFGSLETHIGEEIKVIGAAITDACVLEANCEVDEGQKGTTPTHDTYSFCIQECGSSENKSSVSSGSDQFELCSLSKANITNQQTAEADSVSEGNSFKCRVEEVPVQYISETVGIEQPSMVTIEGGSSGMLSEDGMPVVEASSVEQLDSQFSLLSKELLACDAPDADSSFGNNELVQDRSSEALPEEDGRPSDSTTDDPMALKADAKSDDLLTEDGGPPAVEASSAD